MSVRTTVVQAINSSAKLRELGLPEDAVYQADTADNILGFPFVVLRWMDEAGGVGRASIRPAQAWVYDEPGDFSRAELIGAALLEVVGELEAVKTESGVLMCVRTRGTGLGRGRDFYDDGYKAITIPHYFNVIATGV